jgi:hypothetical protein
MQMTQAPQGAPGEGDPAAGGPEGDAAPGPDAQGGPTLDEVQEAPPEGDTSDDEAEAGDDQGSAPKADSAALAKQMVGKMAGQFGKALATGERDDTTSLGATPGGSMHPRGTGAAGADLGDAFGSVIPSIWRLEG